MNPAFEWIANISIKWILVIAGLLLVARMALPRVRGLPRAWTAAAAEAVESALIAVVLVFLVIRPFLLQAYYIPSGSMLDTLHIDDRILVNKLVYRVRAPKRGDIVVFPAPPQASRDQKELIKRLIGQPGDTIEVVPDTLLVDGKPAVRINDVAGDDSGDFLHAPQHGIRWLDRDRSPRVEGNELRQNGQPRVVVTPSGRAEPRGEALWVDGRRVASAGNRFRGSTDLTPFGAAAGAEGTAYYGMLPEEPALIVLKGKRLTLRPGYVSVNGKPLREPYIRQSPRYEMPPFKVPPGDYFVMGDNRNDSNDSHAWGPLDGRRIEGRAMVIFWPPGRVGVL